MNLDAARGLITRFASQKILVVGDLMLDRYIHGTVNRISPEAPVPVVRVRQERDVPGGAANVARNVAALGGRSEILGVVGRDEAGDDLLQVLQTAKVGVRGVLRKPGACTTTKTRILAERQQVVRVDWESNARLTARERAMFCRRLETALSAASGVILADYNKGTIGQDIVDIVLRSAQQARSPVALDPKEGNQLQLSRLTVATPNRKEAFALAGQPDPGAAADPLHDKPLLRVAERLLRAWTPEFLLITLGAQGMLIAARDARPQHVATVAREVFDVSGAGDTVIATQLLAITAGANRETAAALANCAAGVVVGKLGTATCSAAELITALTRAARNCNRPT